MATATATARISGGNIKLGNMGSFSKLYGNDTFDTKYGAVTGTCGHHCEGCKHACYVRKSYRYPSVVNGHARNTIAFRDNIVQAFTDIDGQLTRKRNPWDVVRINQSGEIESTLELTLWMCIARKHAESKFYLYTKNFDAIADYLKNWAHLLPVPDNFTVLVSVWHEYGLREFSALAEYPWIKAFVYMDGFDYNAHGLGVETMCTAYDESGKMNHALTCDKCRKCFDSNFKVIGCFDH